MANAHLQHESAQSISHGEAVQRQTQAGHPVPQQQHQSSSLQTELQPQSRIQEPGYYHDPTGPQNPPHVSQASRDPAQEQQEANRNAHTRDQSWDAQR